MVLPRKKSSSLFLPLKSEFDIVNKHVTNNPNDFIKIVTTDEINKKVEELLTDNNIDHMVVKTPNKESSNQIVKIQLESPEEMMKFYIEQNHPALIEAFGKLL